MSKKEFGVIVPMAGQLYVTVEAETEEEAIEIALSGKCGDGTDDITIDELEEWEIYKEYNSGNVCNISTNWEAEAEEI